MKAVLRLAALALSLSTVAVAAPVPEPDFLLPVAKASKGREVTAGKPEFSLSAWQNCVFYCADGTVRMPMCNVPPSTVATCCAFSANPNNPVGCGAAGGLLTGGTSYCTDGTTTTYCP